MNQLSPSHRAVQDTSSPNTASSLPSSRANDAAGVTSIEYPAFDWLRFILASVVALGHVGLISHSEITGNLAVQVFFSLSGWLIGGILMKTGLAQLPRFFFNRATRIWIPYFFAVGALYSLSALRDPVTARWLQFLFFDATFTHNWFSLRPNAAEALAHMPLKGTGNGFWSISVEEQFYLVAPLIIVFMRFGRSPVLWAFIFSALWGAQLVDFASISLGVLATTLRNSYGDIHLRPRFVVTLVCLALVSLPILGTHLYSFAAPFFAISIVLLCARPGHRTAVGMFAGAISYPMYLNHWMASFAINGLTKRVDLLPHAMVGLTSYAGATLVGSIAYLLIDRNVLKHRNEYYSPRVGKVSAGLAYTLVLLGVTGGLLLLR